MKRLTKSLFVLMVGLSGFSYAETGSDVVEDKSAQEIPDEVKIMEETMILWPVLLARHIPAAYAGIRFVQNAGMGYNGRGGGPGPLSGMGKAANQGYQRARNFVNNHRRRR